MSTSSKSNRSRRWIFFDTGPGSGAFNMEFDASLFSRHRPGETAPVFRLYSWSPPAVSLGRFQRRDEVVDAGGCAAAGVEVVRRITGGGAILHGEELTYSLVCGDGDLGARGVKESYRRICGFLLRAYRELGLDPVYAVDAGPAVPAVGKATPICFAGNEPFDIRVGGRKIGGNAQRRRRGVVFQHGSIPLRFDPELFSRCFRAPLPAANAAGLRELLPGLKPEDLKTAVVRAFAGHFGVDLVEPPPESRR